MFYDHTTVVGTDLEFSSDAARSSGGFIDTSIAGAICEERIHALMRKSRRIVVDNVNVRVDATFDRIRLSFGLLCFSRIAVAKPPEEEDPISVPYPEV